MLSQSVCWDIKAIIIPVATYGHLLIQFFMSISESSQILYFMSNTIFWSVTTSMKPHDTKNVKLLAFI